MIDARLGWMPESPGSVFRRNFAALSYVAPVEPEPEPEPEEED